MVHHWGGGVVGRQEKRCGQKNPNILRGILPTYELRHEQTSDDKFKLDYFDCNLTDTHARARS